jgi:hypothetical protein
VARPGDPAPGGRTFDYFEDSWLNNRGDIAFGAHLAGDECITVGVSQEVRLFCATSIFLKPARGATMTIAHQGDPAPGGGTYRLAFGPILNNRGDLAFIGDLTSPPDFGKTLAVFLRRGDQTASIARPGDTMPGGGRLVTASFNVIDLGLNDRGEVAFSGILDTADTDDGFADSGVFVWSRGTTHLVVRSGTVLPGIGTIARVGFPAGPLVSNTAPFSGAAINNAGQIMFQVTVTSGSQERGILLLATPAQD